LQAHRQPGQLQKDGIRNKTKQNKTKQKSKRLTKKSKLNILNIFLQ
jgi:hypothetical protein